jgi:hypothetical protein
VVRGIVPVVTKGGWDGGVGEPSILATPELDRAMVRFVSDAVDARMAEDPIYARLRRLPLPEGVTGVSVEVEQTALNSPSVPMEHSDSVTTVDMVEGNFEELHRIVLGMAESFLGQYLPAFFQHVETAVESVGNSLDLSGEEFGWERILDAFEQVEWAPDDRGIVRPPQMARRHHGRCQDRSAAGLDPGPAGAVRRNVDQQAGGACFSPTQSPLTSRA